MAKKLNPFAAEFFLWKIPPYYLPIIWLIITTVGLFMPNNNIPDVDDPVNYFDKVIHFILFFGLTFLTLRDVKRNGSRRIGFWIAVLLVFSLLYGVLAEYIQEFYLNRDGNVPDLVADMVGAVAGIIAAKYWRH